MKTIKLLNAFFNKSRLLFLFVIVISVLALTSVIITSASFIDLTYDYRLLETSTLKNAYYCTISLTSAEYDDGGINYIQNRTLEVISELERDPFIEHVYTQKTANYISYKGFTFGVVIYEPGFADKFPLLKKCGIDFSADPEGILLSSNYFGDIKRGESFEAVINNGASQFKTYLVSAGLFRYPYKYISFSGYGTYLYASDIISNSPVLIMQATEKNTEFVEEHMNTLTIPGFIFTFKDETPERYEQVLVDRLSKTCSVDSFDNIVARTKEMAINDAKKQLLRPGFLMISAVLSYLSIVILMVVKKQKDMAVFYLCGAEKRDLIRLLFWVCVIISAVPAVISTVYILTAPVWQYKWKYIPVVSGSVIINDQIWIVVAFFVLTVIVSFAAALLSMGRKSPLEYLRGLE